MGKILLRHQSLSEQQCGASSVVGSWTVESWPLQRHEVMSPGLRFSLIVYFGDRRGCASAAACSLDVGGLEVVR